MFALSRCGSTEQWKAHSQPALVKGDPMGEHGASFSGESIYDDTDEGKGVVRIASVAALGGFLFGYDSAVINGANSAIESQFNADAASLGFAVASALLGAAAGALIAGRIADHIGRLMVMRIAAILFFVAALGTGLAPNLCDAGGLPDRRRPRCRYRLGDRAGVHRRDRAGEAARPTRLAAATRHRHRHLHLAAGRLHHRRRWPAVPARTGGWAWRPGGGCSSPW